MRKDVADRREVKYTRPSSTMERTAQSHRHEGDRNKLDLYRKAKEAEAAQEARPVSDEEIARLTQSFLDEPHGRDAFEECCRRLIHRHIELKTGSEPRTGLTGEDLLANPALLGCIAGNLDLASGNGGEEVIPFTEVVAPVAAAAVLLQSAGPITPLRQGEKAEWIV